MTQQNAPIAAGELHDTLRALDARGERPSGLVMSPETWAILATDAGAAQPADAVYAGRPVWLQIDCDGVELMRSTDVPAEVVQQAVEEVWL